MRLKPLKWEKGCKDNSIFATESISIAGIDIKIRYDVSDSFMCIQYPNSKSIVDTYVCSINEGKELCEECRSKFWKSVRGDVNKMFTKSRYAVPIYLDEAINKHYDDNIKKYLLMLKNVRKGEGIDNLDVDELQSTINLYLEKAEDATNEGRKELLAITEWLKELKCFYFKIKIECAET